MYNFNTVKALPYLKNTIKPYMFKVVLAERFPVPQRMLLPQLLHLHTSVLVHEQSYRVLPNLELLARNGILRDDRLVVTRSDLENRFWR